MDNGNDHWLQQWAWATFGTALMDWDRDLAILWSERESYSFLSSALSFLAFP